MLSYQHAFHAGNHADIIKHYVVSFILNSLNKKEKPYTVYDTHSGSGLYDLLDNRSLKTNEANSGIVSLMKQNEFPPELKLYLDTVNSFYNKNLYPGSPVIESSFIRSQDFLFLTELHPAEYENLQNNLGNKKNIQIKKINGFEFLKKNTPPVTKRGFVLIDPSYEESSDYIEVSKTVISCFKKWTNGIFAIWYPLLAHRSSDIIQMKDSIIEAVHEINKNTEICDVQLLINTPESHVETDLQTVLNDEDKKNPPRLYGSGMLVINSPWHLDEESKIVTEYLSGVLGFQKNL